MNIEHRMKLERRTAGSWRLVLGALAIGLVLSTGAQTSTNSAANESPWPTLDKFDILQQKNIFDPNRRPYRPIPPGRTGPRIDAFALKGTMSYSKGRFAFFDGTSEQYNKVLGVGGNIAGYTVKEITQNDVTLEANGKEFKMLVGRQVRKQNGNWQMGRPVETSNDETNGDETQATAGGDPSAAPVGANAQMTDILKRLMQAKEQELKEIK